MAARRCQEGAKVNLDPHNKNSLVKFTQQGLNCESWGLKKKSIITLLFAYCEGEVVTEQKGRVMDVFRSY